MFENNYENLLTIDFINENELTNDLDQILKYSKVINTSIISILKKYCKTGDKLEKSWLENRLINLRNNIYIDNLIFDKVLAVYESFPHETYGECWGPKHLTSSIQLEKWIEKTIK